MNIHAGGSSLRSLLAWAVSGNQLAKGEREKKKKKINEKMNVPLSDSR